MIFFHFLLLILHCEFIIPSRCLQFTVSYDILTVGLKITVDIKSTMPSELLSGLIPILSSFTHANSLTGMVAVTTVSESGVRRSNAGGNVCQHCG